MVGLLRVVGFLGCGTSKCGGTSMGWDFWLRWWDFGGVGILRGGGDTSKCGTSGGWLYGGGEFWKRWDG